MSVKSYAQKIPSLPNVEGLDLSLMFHKGRSIWSTVEVYTAPGALSEPEILYGAQ